ncbi:MAG: hypothetical protein Q4B79_04790 [Moraxella sp.]|uniref:hypothetical protein n=1 Tax=Moraxella sp. TaxID=479 RepID=UPI0026DC6425|nr:hypothetical protein [Moraxella sp.]MDO4450260.1 hypothetical protein [Moraxella sp.]
MQDKPVKEIEVADFVVTAKDNVMPSVLVRYNANKNTEPAQSKMQNDKIGDWFDDDVLNILLNLPKTSKDRQIINGLIRAVYA